MLRYIYTVSQKSNAPNHIDNFVNLNGFSKYYFSRQSVFVKLVSKSMQCFSTYS